MLEILDTSLRDGGQNTAINYSLIDKLDTISSLDKFGITFIEMGAPGFNALDAELADSSIPLKNAKLVGFGSTRKKLTAACDDTVLMSLINSKVDYISLFGKASILHIEEVLQTTKEENLAMIADSITMAVKHNKSVIFDAEHFFDGYKQDSDYAISVLKAATDAGASRIVLCDTNGGATPEEVYAITKLVVELLPNCIIGIHCHNDMGLAVANTLSAVNAGAKHIQGTLNGIGERCGNANLSILLPILQISKGYTFNTNIQLDLLKNTAFTLASIANMTVPDNAPFIGRAAFAHKAGMHADGVLKSTNSFEHIDPSIVGNTRKFILSGSSGKHIIFKKLQPFFPELDRNDPKLDLIHKKIKEQEKSGITYEGAEASFIILAHDILRKKMSHFALSNYTLVDNSAEKQNFVSVTIDAGHNIKTAEAYGVGPVHAIDLAMRECLVALYPTLADTRLIDYKVRVINPKSATSALVSVVITSTNNKHIWRTVGVDSNIIKASINALTDSHNYALFIENL
ncbi:MAG: citramalate synthase [Bacillota bacterium]